MIIRFDFVVDDNQKESLTRRVMDVIPNQLVAISEVQREITVNEQTAREIYDYFLNRAGYISYEFDTPTHKFINRLKVFINDCEKEDKETTTN